MTLAELKREIDELYIYKPELRDATIYTEGCKAGSNGTYQMCLTITPKEYTGHRYTHTYILPLEELE